MLYDLCELISKSLEQATEKLRQSGGSISSGDADYVNKLTHAMKSIKTTIAMMESEGGHSGRSYAPVYSGISDATHMGPGTGSYADGSYADYSGRRDGMGRFTSRDGGSYSYHGSMRSLINEMRGMMGQLPDEERREVQRFVEKMDRM